jgi:hypothetical protein
LVRYFSFRHCLLSFTIYWYFCYPFQRLHAVHTYRRPSTDHKYCVWNSVDETLELIKSNKDKYGKLYKEA